METLSSLDFMILLGAVAQRTRHMLSGTGVLVVPFRNPYQLSKVTVSVDALSYQCLILGLSRRRHRHHPGLRRHHSTFTMHVLAATERVPPTFKSFVKDVIPRFRR